MSDGPAFLLEPGEGGVDLVVTGAWGKAAEDALSRGEADGLTLNYARGFREHDLDFLQAWPLRRLRILARTLDDFTPVHRLSATLEHLSVQAGSRTIIDLRRLTWLTAVAADWPKSRRRSSTRSGSSTCSSLPTTPWTCSPWHATSHSAASG